MISKTLQLRTMKTVLVFLCLFCHLLACTQDSTSKKPLFLYAVATYDFPKSYVVSFGTSIPFHSITTRKHPENLRISATKDEFICAELGADRRPFAYTSIYVNAGIGIRFSRSEIHFTELSFEQGIVRTFYDGQVYEQQSDGSIKELTLFGRTYASSGFSYSQNWSISNRHKKAWFIQIKPSVWIQYPYNSFLKPHLSLQAGLSYHLRNVAIHSRTKYTAEQ